jgi:hypothetical protein
MWDNDRVIVRWTPYKQLVNNPECVSQDAFAEIVPAGARLKIELRAKYKVVPQKKATRDFPGAWIYTPGSGKKTLGCYPILGRVKNPDCV